LSPLSRRRQDRDAMLVLQKLIRQLLESRLQPGGDAPPAEAGIPGARADYQRIPGITIDGRHRWASIENCLR
jgi:hypothetical protein